MSISLVGHIGLSFGTFLTFRGIASLHDLEKVSIADEGYQRDLYEPHLEEIKKFLEAGSYTFFPELIFSADLGTESLKAKALYESVSNTNMQRTRFGSFTLKIKTDKIKPKLFSRCIMDIDTGVENILKRIDGNHRLSAVKKFDNVLDVPFCILFYITNPEKFDRILFNNINFKSQPLTTEENLRLIFGKKSDGNFLFSNDELEDTNWFGKHYKTTRDIFYQIDLEQYINLKPILLDDNGSHLYTRTVILELLNLLENVPSQEQLTLSLQEVNASLGKFSSDFKNLNYKLIIILIYYQLKNKLDIFLSWVAVNQIYKLHTFDVKGLINIFNSILESKNRTIFLAMQFCDHTKQNYNAIMTAIKELNNKTNLDLQLVRIDKSPSGFSKPIIDQIFQYIEQAGFLIADLSLANQNVYYELGYRMGLNTGKNMSQENFLLIHNSSVTKADFEKDIFFNISHLQVRRFTNNLELKDTVISVLSQFYHIDT